MIFLLIEEGIYQEDIKVEPGFQTQLRRGKERKQRNDRQNEKEIVKKQD